MSWGQDAAGVDVKLHVEVVGFAERGIVLIAQAVIQCEVRTDLPFVLAISNVIFLCSLAQTRCAVVKHARIGKVPNVPEARQAVCEKIREVVVRVLSSTLAIGVETHRADLTAEFHTVLSSDPGEVVNE